MIGYFNRDFPYTSRYKDKCMIIAPGDKSVLGEVTAGRG